MQRRTFLQAGAAAASHLLVVSSQPAAAQTDGGPELRLALIGGGYQGRNLLSAAMAVGGVRVQAVCDIWEYSRRYCRSFLQRYDQEVQLYEDFREMLDKERELDAVLVATPDFVHEPQVNACLEAGLHVYCEPMLAHTLDAARSMIDSMRRSGKLLQIGYQRRSDPRYRHAQEKLIAEAQLLGRVTVVQTQWAQEAADLRGWPKRYLIPDEVLHRYGYEDMHQFRNWIWYPQYSSGPYGAFVSQQLDVCQWFLDVAPRTVMASGGRDFFTDRPGLDTVLSVYEYPHSLGPVRVSCAMLTTTSGDGTRQFERFLGTQGYLQMSDNPRWARIGREPNAPDWDEWIKQNYVVKQERVAAHAAKEDELDVHVSGEVEQYQFPVMTQASGCQAHLENFFQAVRGREPLRCPADAAFPSQVAAFKAIEAVQAGATVTFAPSDFTT